MSAPSPSTSASSAGSVEVEAYPAFAALTAAVAGSIASAAERAEVHFSADGRRLLVCCSRAAAPGGPAWWIHVWDLEQGRITGSFAHKATPEGGADAPFVAWSPAGSYVVTRDRYWVRLFRSDTLRLLREAGADYGVHAVDPRDERLLTGLTNEDTSLIDIATGRSIARRITHNAATGFLVDLDFSPTGTFALADGLFWRRNGAEVARWDKLVLRRGTPDLARDPLPDTPLPWPNDAPLGWAWSRDESRVLVAARDTLTAIDLAKGKAVWRVGGVAPPIALTPGGDELVHMTPSGKVAVLRLADQAESGAFTDVPSEPDAARDEARFDDDAIRFSADGSRFVVQRTFAQLRVCTVAERSCARLPWITERNADPPRWRGADLYLRTPAGIVVWSSNPGHAWRLDAVAHTGFDVSADGRYVAAASAPSSGPAAPVGPCLVAVARLPDKQVVVLSSRFSDGAWSGSLTPEQARSLRP